MKLKLSDSQKRSNGLTVNTGFKKMEGFDIVAKNLKTDNLTKTLVKQTLLPNSAQLKEKKNNLKNDSSQAKIDEENIKSLEVQLQLLREQELKTGPIKNEFLFEDEVAINSNVLALRSQYRNIKNAGEKQIDVLNESILNELKKQQELQSSFSKYESKIKDLENDMLSKSEFHDRMEETLKIGLFDEKEHKIARDKRFTEMNEGLKKMNDENVFLLRKLEKEKILKPQTRENDANQIFSLKSKITQNEENIKVLEKELEIIGVQIKANQEQRNLQQQNLEIESKILKIEKDMASFNMKTEDLLSNLELNKSKRVFELQQKKVLVSKIEELRRKIEDNSKVNDILISQKVVEKQKEDLNKALFKIDKLRREKEFIFEQIKKEEGKIDCAVQEKTTLKQQEFEEKDLSDLTERKKADLLTQSTNVRREIEIFTQKEQKYLLELPKIEVEVNEKEKIFPKIQEEIGSCLKELEMIRQQRELSKQIKRLNLQDLKISKEANLEVNENLNRLIRNYQNILSESTNK